MSYDLYPKNKKVEGISVGAFSWPIILNETGAGFVLGYGNTKNPAEYCYVPDSRGASPASNDGYFVNATDAKSMAKCLRGYVRVHRFINKEWEEIPEEDRERQQQIKVDGRAIYKTGTAETRLVEIEKIAEFMEQSNGFKIR